MTDPRSIVIEYHDRTKHHFNRYARSLGYLDWASQPNPFRRYEGARLFRLPFQAIDPTPLYDDLYSSLSPPQPINIGNLARFLEMSLAISAWKQIPGTRWALRCNPSSGNLHPTEGYLVAGPLEGLNDKAGVYHYAPLEHALEARASLSDNLWLKLRNGYPNDTFFVGLTSIFWREAWKYGERAFRYCQHDLGHSMGALAIAAGALAWRANAVNATDDDLTALLGLDRTNNGDAEAEHPELLVAITQTQIQSRPSSLDIGAEFLKLKFVGRANQLSSDHVDWEVIDEVAAATYAHELSLPSEADDRNTGLSIPAKRHNTRLTTYAITRQRRSAVALDGETSLSSDAFFTMLARTMPGAAPELWSAFARHPNVHLVLFVHRVDALERGLYMLLRTESDEAALRDQLRPQFAWSKPPACPERLPLFLLQGADCRQLAATLSCGQDIAGDGAFAAAMLARFVPALDELGPQAYRRLFWECGFIGQILYLEAEAAGLRATGIGCYFDDPTHHTLGLTGNAFQSLYHFTVGGPVEDTRLTTLPPYDEPRLRTSGWGD